ncbi:MULTISPECIES: hypothetical protein [unclassified Saccharothrix]|uniref:hypothetical protein n=1 Tax=unclassified Saccharothrix TaxID=2593673 RepID=UPI00307D836A
MVLALVELKSDDRAARALLDLAECWLDIDGVPEANERFGRLLSPDQLSPGLISAFLTRFQERMAD